MWHYLVLFLFLSVGFIFLKCNLFEGVSLTLVSELGHSICRLVHSFYVALAGYVPASDMYGCSDDDFKPR